MRCLACNVILSDFEATRKFSGSGTFVDLCNHCFHSGVDEQIDTNEREDLHEIEDDETKEIS